MGGGSRYFGGAVAFGFAAMWIMTTLAAALVCLLAAAVGYGAVVVAGRARAKRGARVGVPGSAAQSTSARRSRTLNVEDFPFTVDALNSDLGYVYEPNAAMSALAREAEFGWPLEADTGTPGETLH